MVRDLERNMITSQFSRHQTIVSAAKMQASISKRQVISQDKELPENLFIEREVDGKMKFDVDKELMLQLLNKHSIKFKKILRIDKCGSGGESFVIRLDLASGSDIVVKFPNNAEDSKSA